MVLLLALCSTVPPLSVAIHNLEGQLEPHQSYSYKSILKQPQEAGGLHTASRTISFKLSGLCCPLVAATVTLCCCRDLHK